MPGPGSLCTTNVLRTGWVSFLRTLVAGDAVQSQSGMGMPGFRLVDLAVPRVVLWATVGRAVPTVTADASERVWHARSRRSLVQCHKG